MTKLLGGAAIAPLLLVGMSLSSAQAQSTSDSAQLQAEINALKAQMKALESKMKTTQTKQAQQAQQLQASYPPPAPYEPPFFADKKFHMGAITITPGGFLAAEALWRQHDVGTDITSPSFGSIPFDNSPLYHMGETRFTARQSRVSSLVEGAINPSTVVTAYGEVDFLGAANTANSNESNSYTPRIRVLYSTLDMNDVGFHVLAGQSWSLATLQGEGISPRKEVIPATIDAQYVAGFTWARQPGIRLTENFGNGFSVAVSAEQSQTTGCPSLPGGAAPVFPPAAAPPVVAGLPAGINGITCSQQGSSLLDGLTTYSINQIPDIIGKVAWDPNIADRKVHLEAMGLYSDFYDRVDTTAGNTQVNRNTTGWGLGGGLTAQIMPHFLDLQGSVLYGRGIGRYGSGQLSDVALAPDGSLNGLPELMFLGGATVHATPWLDLYAYGGQERITNQTFLGGVGYANPAVDNSGCATETTGLITAACKGATKDVWEVTGGFWDKIYSGAYGSVRAGLQYSYIRRDLFQGTGSSAGLPAFVGTPSTTENTVMASFRYYPFDNPAPAPTPVISKY
ncbi:MAG: hypothetical protein ACLPID_15755 [Beijerinckiaceae bacterium]